MVRLYFELYLVRSVSYKMSLTEGTIASKINGTPKDVHLPISELHSILAVVIMGKLIR